MLYFYLFLGFFVLVCYISYIRFENKRYKKSLIDRLSKTIYYNYSGMTNEDYLNITGKDRIDFDLLSEHEKDEYRFIAKKVIEEIE